MDAIFPLLGIFAFAALGYAFLDAQRSVGGSADAKGQAGKSVIS